MYRYRPVGFYYRNFRFHALQVLAAGSALMWALIMNAGFLIANGASWLATTAIRRHIRFSRRDAGVMMFAAYCSFCMCSSVVLFAAAQPGLV